MNQSPKRTKSGSIDTPARRIQVMSTLMHHIGKANAIGMGDLYYKVFGEAYEHRINDTRPLRQILKDMKDEGSPICSHCSSNGGGYYLAVGSELGDYHKSVFMNAVGRLARLGHQRKMSLQELSAQTVLLLEAYNGSH